jgi:hypothetical protein
MSISVVQTLAAVGAFNVASLQSGAFGSSPVTGNTILVVIGTFKTGGTTVSSVTDTAGNTYVLDKRSVIDPQNRQHSEVWRSSNITGGANLKITVTPAATAHVSFSALEVSGLVNASPLDGAGSSNDGTGTSPTTGAYSTTNANDLLLVATVNDSTPVTWSATPAGFTDFGQIVSASALNIDNGYEIVAATQTNINPAWTISPSSDWNAVGLAYKASAAAIAPVFVFFDNELSNLQHLGM